MIPAQLVKPYCFRRSSRKACAAMLPSCCAAPLPCLHRAAASFGVEPRPPAITFPFRLTSTSAHVAGSAQGLQASRFAPRAPSNRRDEGNPANQELSAGLACSRGTCLLAPFPSRSRSPFLSACLVHPSTERCAAPLAVGARSSPSSPSFRFSRLCRHSCSCRTQSTGLLSVRAGQHLRETTLTRIAAAGDSWTANGFKAQAGYDPTKQPLRVNAQTHSADMPNVLTKTSLMHTD